MEGLLYTRKMLTCDILFQQQYSIYLLTTISMNNQHTVCRRSVPTSYAEVMARGLTRYADTNTAYGQWLSALIVGYMDRLDHSDISDPSTHHEGIVPHAEDLAVRRALWLLDSIAERRMPGYKNAGAVLRQWYTTRTHDEPKALVLGVMYGVLDFGMIGEPRKKREPMGVLIRHDVLQQVPGLELANLLNKMTHGVVEQGLIMAQGSTSRLEPELGDWLFGDKALAVYRAEARDLRNIKSHLEHMGAPYAHRTDDLGVIALAFSPSLYINDLPGHEALEAVRV